MAEFINTIDLLGDDVVIDSIIDRSITEFNDDKILTLRGNIFESCSLLASVKLPALTSIGNGHFNCNGLVRGDFTNLTVLSNFGFNGASKLAVLVLRGNTMCTLYHTNAIHARAPIAKGTGYIYVPRALVDSYKTATNWSTFATQFRALEDYTVDGTTIGELDETKI